jgi:hypothetical protein
MYSQLFRFTFLDVAESTGVVVAEVNKSLSYKISSSPSNIQLTAVEV